MSLKTLAIVTSLVFGGIDGFALAREPMPPGIGVRLTIGGPALVDQHGMTLYRRTSERSIPCPDHPETVRVVENVVFNAVDEIPMRVPDAASRRSCAEKYRPLLAPAEAKPIGNWTLQLLENGTRQWAYRGHPLHTSIKDKEPGDINGQRYVMPVWKIAEAPLDVPPGVESRVTSRGLVLATYEGKPLYYPTSTGGATHGADWKPLQAPLAVSAANVPADWSIVKTEGISQWAWKGKPLYTYAHDAGGENEFVITQFVEIFGGMYGKPVSGWQVAVLRAPSAAPAGLRVVPVSRDASTASQWLRIYANAQGKTLYTVYCDEQTADRLDCDDVGDSPRYWSSYCGGEDRCRRDWQPLIAPANAHAIDGMWSIAVINRSHPFKPVAKGEDGLTVWTYLGRPVFTSARDEKPGDIRAISSTFEPMFVGLIPVFETD